MITALHCQETNEKVFPDFYRSANRLPHHKKLFPVHVRSQSYFEDAEKVIKAFVREMKEESSVEMKLTSKKGSISEHSELESVDYENH